MAIQTALDSISNSTSGSPFGFKNRIINGDMRIDQRNAGASVTPTALSYTLDRWVSVVSVASKFSIEQSSTAPAGFSNSALITSLSTYTVGTAEIFNIGQRVEGFNTANLAWGSANAASVMLSFWVRSSLTGTFGGALRNSAADRSYPFSYTISAANTWEKKSVTIAGDTSGTWLTTNGIGINLTFGLGVGSTFSGTAGAWAAGNFVSATGATSVVGTNGATFYITGVQLEKGSTATSFDYRPYGTELALCQRYFITTRTSSENGGTLTTGQAVNTSRFVFGGVQFPVIMRAAPTTTVYSAADDTAGAVVLYNAVNSGVGSGFSVASSNPQGIHNRVDGSASLTSGNWYSFSYTASAEL
jgi:hypothetical protein